MYIVGIDEVGRGCWAGPLVAAAVLLSADISGLRDSKLTTRQERTVLAQAIRLQAAQVSLGWVWPADIDRIGLTAAVALAMRETLAGITLPYDQVIIDGNYNFIPGNAKVSTCIKADAIVPAVSAASIVAKVARDTYMTEVAAVEFPEYGFENHVGYGTKAHITALEKHGVTTIHRLSYKPIRQILVQSNHA